MVSKPFQAISAHWANPYIGQPWSKHGQGPDAWNCWSFFRHVQQVHFGVATPMVPYADDLLVLARLFRDHQERGRWQPVTAYREGDGVMMRTARYPIHVGVWLEVDGGRVLHCAAGAGVVCQSRRDLAANGWRKGLMKAFLQGALKLALAMSLALIATVAVIAGGYKFFEDRQKDQDRMETAPFEAVSRRTVDLKKPLDLEFFIETKLVNGYMYTSVRAAGHPQYLEHPANKEYGTFLLNFSDKDGFKIYEKTIPIKQFTIIWGGNSATGLSYQYKEHFPLSDYKRFDLAAIEWTVDPKVTPQKPQATTPKPVTDTPDPCTPGLSKAERLSRLAKFGEVRQTASDTYTAGARQVAYYGSQFLYCH